MTYSFRTVRLTGAGLGYPPGVYTLAFRGANGDVSPLYEGVTLQEDWHRIEVTPHPSPSSGYLWLNGGGDYFRAAAIYNETDSNQTSAFYDVLPYVLVNGIDPTYMGPVCGHAFVGRAPFKAGTYVAPYLSAQLHFRAPITGPPVITHDDHTALVTEDSLAGEFFIGVSVSMGDLFADSGVVPGSEVRISDLAPVTQVIAPSIDTALTNVMFKGFASYNLVGSLDGITWFVLAQNFCVSCSSGGIEAPIIECNLIGQVHDRWTSFLPGDRRPYVTMISDLYAGWTPPEPAHTEPDLTNPLNPMFFPGTAYGYFGSSSTLAGNPLQVPHFSVSSTGNQLEVLSLPCEFDPLSSEMRFVFSTVHPVFMGLPKRAWVLIVTRNQLQLVHAERVGTRDASYSGVINRYTGGQQATALFDQTHIVLWHDIHNHTLSISATGGAGWAVSTAMPSSSDRSAIRNVKLGEPRISLGWVTGGEVTDIRLLPEGVACCYGIGSAESCRSFWLEQGKPLDPTDPDPGNKPIGAPPCDLSVVGHCCPNQTIVDGQRVCQKELQPAYRSDDPYCSCHNSDHWWKYGIIGLNPVCSDGMCFTRGHVRTDTTVDSCGQFCGNIIQIPEGDLTDLDGIIQQAHCGDRPGDGLGTGVIVGIVVATLLLLALVGGGGYYYYYHYAKRK